MMGVTRRELVSKWRWIWIKAGNWGIQNPDHLSLSLVNPFREATTFYSAGGRRNPHLAGPADAATVPDAVAATAAVAVEAVQVASGADVRMRRIRLLVNGAGFQRPTASASLRLIGCICQKNVNRSLHLHRFFRLIASVMIMGQELNLRINLHTSAVINWRELRNWGMGRCRTSHCFFSKTLFKSLM